MNEESVPCTNGRRIACPLLTQQSQSDESGNECKCALQDVSRVSESIGPELFLALLSLVRLRRYSLSNCTSHIHSGIIEDDYHWMAATPSSTFIGTLCLRCDDRTRRD